MILKMFKCSEITEMACVEKKLSMMDRMQFRIHTVMCGACNSYVKQVTLLRMHWETIVVKKIKNFRNDQKLLKDELLKKYRKSA